MSPKAKPPAEPQLANPIILLSELKLLLTFLDQGNIKLRPPQPRPEFEKLHHFLQVGDYDPKEMADAKLPRKLGGYSKLKLTIPAPQPPFEEGDWQDLLNIFEDGNKLTFYYHLLVAAGLALPGKVVQSWSAVRQRFNHLTITEQWQIVVEAYWMIGNWSELWQVLAQHDEVQVKRRFTRQPFLPEEFYADLERLRHMVIHQLAALASDVWYDSSYIKQILRTLWPGLNHQRGFKPLYSANFSSIAWELESKGQTSDSESQRAPLAKGAG